MGVFFIVKEPTSMMKSIRCDHVHRGVSLTWDGLAVGGVALRTLRHSSVAVGDNIYVYGGIQEGNPTNDLMVFNTDNLVWQKWEVIHECKGAFRQSTLSATSIVFSVNMTAVVSRGGGEMRDLCSDAFTVRLFHIAITARCVAMATTVPNVRYELSECVPPNQSRNTPVNAQVSVNRDFSAVRDQAMKMIQTAFTLLNQEFQKLDRYTEKSELSKAAVVLQREKEAHEVHRQQQQQVQHGCIPV
ncbi:hypothetical protein D9C73_019127 [Collichthys lucidus]|uniref:Uncharacterized protein n=1 Tax=Collichthys lucidus TaxID=240159 RepID=A0A4U5V8F9_COLLU|nr:hypothetical protein D9C73_019127 [Collichthys lucidus]